MLGMTEPRTVHYGMWDGASIVLCSYTLVILLITLKRKEYSKAFLLLVPASVMLIAIIYFPGFSSGVIPYIPSKGDITDRNQVFRRIRWTMLILPAISFGMTYIICGMKHFQRILLLIICTLLMVVSVYYTTTGNMGTGFWDRDIRYDHLYKLPYFVVLMGDTIMEENREFLQKDKKNVVSILVGDDEKGQMQAYSDIEYGAKSLRMYLSPVIYEKVDLSDSNCERIIRTECDYALCPDETEIVDMFEKCGYSVEWEMDGVCFLRSTRKR